jgi:methylglutaconyl-CoA hydratase
MAPVLVRVDVTSRVATVTLDSPHNRNAMSRELRVQLADALRATRDADVGAVVLTGADPVFCAGADLKEQADGLGPGPVGLPEIIDLIVTHPRPVVARVNGPARAGGLGLLAACDIAIGLSDATFAFSEVRIGVVPAVISVPVMSRMNPTAAHELFLTGEPFTGTRAAETGLLNRAVDPDGLDQEVVRYTGLLVRGGPNAMAATKRLRHQVVGTGMAARMAELQELSAGYFASAEGQEGIAAFREKRDPSWIEA